MAKYTPDVLYIASIYPGEVVPQRRHYGPSRESAGRNAVRSSLFTLQPVPRGKKPFVLEIMDSFEDVLDVVGSSSSADAKGAKPRLSKPVAVESIASDLLACWTGGLFNVPQGAKPGIIQIADRVPTISEMREMEQQQVLYFSYFFTEGERLHQEKNWKEITGVMRLAAEWLGKKTMWSHRDMAEESFACPLCTTIIPNAAVFCPQCHQQIKAIPVDILKLQAGSQMAALDAATRPGV